MLFLFYLSVFGLTLSLLAHVVTFFGFNLAEYFPLIWGLHLGIFVIALPAIFMEPIVSASRSATGSHNLMLPVPLKFKKILKWYSWYLGLNFIVGILFSVGTNEAVNENKESWAQVFNLHLVSTFWIYFYLLFAVILWYHNERREK